MKLWRSPFSAAFPPGKEWGGGQDDGSSQQRNPVPSNSATLARSRVPLRAHYGYYARYGYDDCYGRYSLGCH